MEENVFAVDEGRGLWRRTNSPSTRDMACGGGRTRRRRRAWLVEEDVFAVDEGRGPRSFACVPSSASTPTVCMPSLPANQRHGRRC